MIKAVHFTAGSAPPLRGPHEVSLLTVAKPERTTTSHGLTATWRHVLNTDLLKKDITETKKLQSKTFFYKLEETQTERNQQ